MKTLKLLNKFVWKVIFFCSVQILFFANANEPEDIWSKNNEDIEINSLFSEFFCNCSLSIFHISTGSFSEKEFTIEKKRIIRIDK